MGNEIEVTWTTKPKSGITTIDLFDLECRDMKEWEGLGKKEQEIRINNYLQDSDGRTLKIVATEWE